MSQNIPPPIPLSDFPSDVLKWMKENAAPKMALKLMKCHKCFQHFSEFPYFVVKKLEYDDDFRKWFLTYLDGRQRIYSGLEKVRMITKKLWITDCLRFIRLPNPALNLIPNVAVCDIITLILGSQEISFNEFKVLTASGNIITLNLYHTTITFQSENPVYIADILKCVPKVTNFVYYNYEIPIFSINFINIYKDINASKIENIDLQMNSFSTFVLFSKFMDLNPHIKYKIEFIPNSLSPQELLVIEKYIQRIIDSGITKHPPPIIECYGESEEQFEELQALSYNYDKLKAMGKLKIDM